MEEKGLAFDRRFVVTDLNGQFLTGRTEPMLTQVRANLVQGGVMLTAPKMPPLMLKLAEFENKYQSVTVWQDTIEGQHCSHLANEWFSQFLDRPCQLLFFGDGSKRKVNGRLTQVGFADGYPLLLISEASLAELNQYSSESLTMAQFRTNLVVNNCDAFAEDYWKRIKIGDVEFEVVKPCSRCIFTTVDPKTAKRSELKEPLKTLSQFRKGEDNEVYFGQNLIALNEGQIGLEDKIEVLAWQTPEVYPDNRLPQMACSQNSQISCKKTWRLGEAETLTCARIIQETHDVKTFIFDAPGEKTVQHIAGQHLPLTIEVDGKTVKRNYTLSSSPLNENNLAITVKRVDGGKVSNYLHDNFSVGDSVASLPPAGLFHLNNAVSDKILLLTGGSGITPALSMLRYLAATQDSRSIVFFHSAHTEQDLIAKDEIANLAGQLNNCQVIYTLTQKAGSEWQGQTGRLSHSMLSNISDIASYSVFVCGPKNFMTAAKALLLEMGLPTHQYFEESFGSRTADNNLDKGHPQKVNILFDSWGVNHQGNNKDSILEQGEAAGLILPYSCRGGYCGSCKVTLVSGEVDVKSRDGLSQAEVEQGNILACSCYPLSDVVINAS